MTLGELDVSRKAKSQMARVCLPDEQCVLGVRNLSSTGIMVEGAKYVIPGTLVVINLPGFGWTAGNVAWSLGDRLGVRFREPLELGPAAVEQSRELIEA